MTAITGRRAEAVGCVAAFAKPLAGARECTIQTFVPATIREPAMMAPQRIVSWLFFIFTSSSVNAGSTR
jgi:hypothetical protein